jgi:DNA-binding transcriptional regulator YhcF (GntR family)
MRKFDDSKPIYLQIKEEIEHAIIQGRLKEEENVSSIRALAQDYRINPQTVSNAMNELINDGILYKKRGIGLFVNQGAKEKLKSQKKREFREYELENTIKKARTLGIAVQELIESINAIYKKEE